MDPSPVRDSLVGLFVLMGLAAIAYLSISLGGASYRGPGGLELIARFDEIGGLKARSDVVVGGVTVGRVRSISLDPDFRPLVRLEIDQGLNLPADSSASILTSGVLGDQYIGLEPGGEERPLASGDEIAYTQSALILERLIGKLVQNLGADDSP